MRVFRKFCWGICLGAMFVATGGTISAQVLATDLGPGDTFSNQRYIIQGNPIPGENVAESYAASFTPDISESLEHILLPLSALSDLTGGPPSITVDIAADQSGSPGSILTDLTQIGSITSSPALVTFACGACPELQPGTKYWIVTGAPFGNTFVGWYLSPTSQLNYDFTPSGTVNGPWNTGGFGTPGFEVDGSTPEPGSAVLMCIALMGFVSRRKSRRMTLAREASASLTDSVSARLPLDLPCNTATVPRIGSEARSALSRNLPPTPLGLAYMVNAITRQGGRSRELAGLPALRRIHMSPPGLSNSQARRISGGNQIGRSAHPSKERGETNSHPFHFHPQ